ncbi:hypothetical protein BC830DRAFT_1104575 [Chytriomyces sp. MP71]|nr:hypothetical protein BC830DRAFT_1104575 [Chytriomyces sp. MP71]
MFKLFTRRKEDPVAQLQQHERGGPVRNASYPLTQRELSLQQQQQPSSGISPRTRTATASAETPLMLSHERSRSRGGGSGGVGSSGSGAVGQSSLLGGSDSFLDDMLFTLDSAFASSSSLNPILDSRSRSAHAPSQPNQSHQPQQLQQQQYQTQYQQQQQGRPTLGGGRSGGLEDDILATFDMLNKIDSGNLPGGLSTTPYSDSPKPKASAGYSSIYNRKANSSNLNSTSAASSPSTSAKASFSNTRVFDAGPPAPTTSLYNRPMPSPISTSQNRSHSTPVERAPAPLSPPPVTKFNRSTKQSAQREYDDAVKQREMTEQQRKIELAKALYFKESGVNISPTSSTRSGRDVDPRPRPVLTQDGRMRPASPGGVLKTPGSMPRSMSAQGVRFAGVGSGVGLSSSDESDSDSDSEASDNRVLGKMVPAGMRVGSALAGKSLSHQAQHGPTGIAAGVGGWPGQRASVVPPARSSSAMEVGSWLRGTQPATSPPPPPSTPPPGMSRRRSRMSIMSMRDQQQQQQQNQLHQPVSVSSRPISLMEVQQPQPLSFIQRRTSLDRKSVRPKTSQTLTIQSMQASESPTVRTSSLRPGSSLSSRYPSSPGAGNRHSTLQIPATSFSASAGVPVSPISRTTSPLNPGLKLSSAGAAPTVEPPQRHLGSANAATLQQLYQANQVKTLGETQQAQQTQQNVMMNYLTQMAIVQQTQMAALLAQQQAQAQQTSMGVVVGLAPALKNAPVGMAVIGGGGSDSSGGKKKKRGKKVAFSDGTDTLEFDSQRSAGSSGNSGGSGGTPVLVDGEVMSPVTASSNVMAGRE